MATRGGDPPQDRNKEPLVKMMPIKYAPATKFPTKLFPFYLGRLFALQELRGSLSPQGCLSASEAKLKNGLSTVVVLQPACSPTLPDLGRH